MPSRHPTSRWAAPFFGALALVWLAACDPPRARTSPATQPGADRRHDKASVFGDARLVPTRAGERARLELALAGQLRTLLEPLRPPDGSVAVDVELGGRGPARVVVVAAGSWPADLRERLDQLVSGVVPEADIALVLAPSKQGRPVEGGGAPWPLALALLGLGVSLGVFVERAAARGGLSLGRLRPAGRR